MAETQKEKLMRILDCTEEEALDIIEKDKIIDKGGRVEFDFDKQKEKEIKKLYVNSKEHKKPAVYKFDKKEKKPDIPKEELIVKLAEFLKDFVEDVEILNKSKLIGFKMGTDNFELDLKRKRKPKGEV